MALALFERLAEEIKGLTPEEQGRLRDLLNQALLDQLSRRLLAKGIISKLPQPDPTYRRNWKPIEIQGKPLSETILVSDHGEPILSMWRLGLGKTAAFTSDVKNRWAVDWLRWSGYNQFWSQLIREIMRHRIQRSFSMRANVEQGLVKVSVDAIDRADRFINGLESSLTVLDPRRPGSHSPHAQTHAPRRQARKRRLTPDPFGPPGKRRVRGTRGTRKGLTPDARNGHQLRPRRGMPGGDPRQWTARGVPR